MREVRAYRATRKFTFGNPRCEVGAGETVFFDGQIGRVGTETRDFPALRAAIRVGWLEPLPEPPEPPYTGPRPSVWYWIRHPAV